MHRQPLLQLLDRYAAQHRDETPMVGRFRDFVQANPRCFERTLEQGHVTGSAWLVDETRSRVLLTHHRKLGIWVQLGGHADGESDVLRVALREAQEESGLTELRPLSEEIFDVDIHEIPARDQEPAHLHYDVRFALSSVGNERFSVSVESHALAWVDIALLSERTCEESMLRMMRKWLAKDHRGRQRSR